MFTGFIFAEIILRKVFQHHFTFVSALCSQDTEDHRQMEKRRRAFNLLCHKIKIFGTKTSTLT